MRRTSLLLSMLLLLAAPAAADDEQPVSEIAAQARRSLVTIHGSDRDANRRAIGTGFVVDGSGLIATNLHCIGEGREFRVESSEGVALPVKAVHASDRFFDLAILQVEWAEDPLPALPLAPPGELADGTPIVVMGNPLGLKNSVVAGVLSGSRELEGRQMLQLAVPVEPGNSGGPVLDRQGRVLGMVTLKSLVSDNLGFALDRAALRRLIAQPNPVPLATWLTLGALDPEQWTTKFGARWRRMGGRIEVRGSGAGFGGRSLCLLNEEPPEAPFEVAVSVKMDDESGAAGLVFCSDGKDRHYGFYPSNGNLRLTCFDGPTVYSWRVLHNQPSPHYRPGQWNHIKIRFESDKIHCFVNDQRVLTSTDQTFHSGRVGLAKFRNTVAEFRHFEVAPQIASRQVPAPLLEELEQQVAELQELESLPSDSLQDLARSPAAAAAVLRRQAEQLERRAEELRKIGQDVHVRSVVGQLQRLLPAEEPDEKAEDAERQPASVLLAAALLIARLDQPELETDEYLEEVERMAREIGQRLADDPSPADRREALDKYLFVDNAFHGSRSEYYHRANSHLNRVIDDREGLPITLSVLYMELGRRIGLPLEGVGLPGHFVVRHAPGEGDSQLIDVFHGAKDMSREEAAELVRQYTGEPLQEQHLAAATSRQILQRMLHNLLGVAQRNDDLEAALRYLEALVALDPQSVSDRGMRSVVRFQTGRKAAAIEDLDWFLEHQPPGLDLERIREMKRAFSRQ